MSSQEQYLTPLNPELEDLLPDKCRPCNLGRKMIRLAAGIEQRPSNDAVKTAEDIDRDCSGYKKEQENEFIVSGINTLARLRELLDNPACPYTTRIKRSG